MTLNQQDKFFLLTAFGTAAVGAGLMVGGFVLRFGRGFGTFVKYAKQDDDFLELGRLDIVFGLFTAAACVLIISFFLALVATLKKNKFLLKTTVEVAFRDIYGQAAGLGIVNLSQRNVLDRDASKKHVSYTVKRKLINVSNGYLGQPIIYGKKLAEKYCAVIAMMIVAQLVAGLLGFQYADSVKVLANNEALGNSINASINNIQSNGGVPGNDHETSFWSHTQKVFECCGVQSATDWQQYQNNDVVMKQLNCAQGHRKDGCEKKIRDRIAQDSQYLAVASMGVLVVEIIASFLAGYRAYNLTYD